MLQQDIEVPETLLKKRKQNEKAREERLEKAVAAKKVRVAFVPHP
jgi:large subunit ribosomal protein L7e